MILSIEELQEKQKKDFAVSVHTIIDDSLKTESLFAEYNKLLAIHTLHLNKLLRKKSKLQISLELYYSGKASDEVYKQKPFNLKIMKNEIYKWVDADDKMQELQEEIDSIDVVRKMLEETLKHFKERVWGIKNAVDMIKFQNGQ